MLRFITEHVIISGTSNQLWLSFQFACKQNEANCVKNVANTIAIHYTLLHTRTNDQNFTELTGQKFIEKSDWNLSIYLCLFWVNCQSIYSELIVILHFESILTELGIKSEISYSDMPPVSDAWHTVSVVIAELDDLVASLADFLRPWSFRSSSLPLALFFGGGLPSVGCLPFWKIY